jgi:MFS superfamily sulfate permease-like transporter
MVSSPSLFSRLPKTFFDDFLASIVVFLVALPLCMGIAIACGVPPALGIITGIIGGLVVGCIGGCPLQVSGPAAGLVVVIADLIEKHGIEQLGEVVLVAGLIQFVVGFSGLAFWFRAVPPSVIHGMLSGIGVLIFAGQFHVMVDDTSKGSGINNLLSIPAAVWKGLTPSDQTVHHLAAIVGVATIVTLFMWEKVVPKKLKVIPGSLVAVILGTAIAAIWQFPIKHVEIPGNLLSVVSLPTWHSMMFMLRPDVWADGLAVAAIASAETLLTAAALDKMSIGGKRTNYDRELAGQGVGNLICGVLGALPMTGVMVRSGVNVNAGAKTRLSAILHGWWLLVFVVGLPFVIRLIPVCSLAALLCYTGYKLANFKVIKELKAFGRSEVVIYAITVGVIVLHDLLTGVMVGVVLSVAKLLYHFSHIEITVQDDPERNHTTLILKGAATFLSLPKLARVVEGVRPTTELHILLEGLDYIDHACLELLMNWDKQHEANGGRLVMDYGSLHAKFKESRRPGGVRRAKRVRADQARAEEDEEGSEEELAIQT